MESKVPDNDEWSAHKEQAVTIVGSMANLLSFQAHPDDESMFCAGTLAKAASLGHDVTLVVATRGEEGEYPDAFVATREDLGPLRLKELGESAAILGVSHVEWLGYRDSGMMGAESNSHPSCFWQAPIEEAAERLASILVARKIDAITVYDDHGMYGHPDHIRVHEVGVRAAELAGISLVFQATANRTILLAMMEAARASGLEGLPDYEELSEFGSPDDVIDIAEDVSAFMEEKRQSMEVHRSQIGSTSFALSMPTDVFLAAFSTEWFIRSHHSEGSDRVSLTGLLEAR